jgi:hypothetical protein
MYTIRQFEDSLGFISASLPGVASRALDDPRSIFSFSMYYYGQPADSIKRFVTNLS